MRSPWFFLPIAYVAGVHGFAIFAPYLATFLAAAVLLRRRRQQQRMPVPVASPDQAAVSPTFQM